MPLVLDASNTNGDINWGPIAAPQKDGGAGIRAVFLKATEGFSFDDARFHEHREAAGALHMRVGAYHFARPDLHPYDPEMEARHFVRVVGKLGPHDMRPVLDLEMRPRKITMRQLADWARGWNRVVRDALGIWPLFYSYSSFVEEMGADRTIGDGLWLANYSRNDGFEHPFVVPKPWQRAVCHQFTSTAVMPGNVGKRFDLSHADHLAPLLAHPRLLSRLPHL